MKNPRQAMNGSTIAITGGGTGGHVFPALAIAEEFRDRGYRAIYVGTKQGMEAKLVPERSIPLITLDVSGIKNQGAGKVFRALWQLGRAVLSCLALLQKEKPAAVVGVGGYVSAPLCLAAWLRGTPVYLQEQNTSVGIANRFLGKFARRIFLGFSEAQKFFPVERCMVTGNPVRHSFDAGPFPLDATKRHLLILGGSQGAKSINDGIVFLLDELYDRFPGLEIVHQTGAKDAASVKEAYAKLAKGPHTVKPFFSDIAERYQWATLVVCRSGALTVTELIQAGRPAIFVPYPRIGQNDQTTNAAFVERNGGGTTVLQGEAFVARLRQAILEAFVPERLSAMHTSLGSLRQRPALATIADRIEEDLGHKK